MIKTLTKMFIAIAMFFSQSTFGQPALPNPLPSGTYSGTYTSSGALVVAIGATVTFDNITLLLAPNSNIHVQGTCTLNIINNSTLKLNPIFTPPPLSGVSPVVQWNNLLVYTNGELIIDSSTIQDALIGVQSYGGGHYEISNTHFIDNGRHIVVRNFSGIHTGTVHSSTFTNSSPFNYNSNYGIQVMNVGHLTIGDPAFAPNRFEYSEIGVYATGSSLDIKNNKFGKLQYYGVKIYGSSLLPVGNGIIHDITVGGSNPNENNHFSQIINLGSNNFSPSITAYGKAIAVNSNVNLNIRNNEIHTCRYGLISDGANNITLEENYMHGLYNSAIRLENTENYNINITDNIIKEVEYAIRIYGQNIAGNTIVYSPLNIANNKLEGAYNGILVKNIYSPVITENKQQGFIHSQLGGSTPTGITVENCKSSTISNNSISREYPNGLLPPCGDIGIKLFNSPVSIVKKNKAEMMLDIGILTIGDFTNTQFSCNTLSECLTGFYFNGGTNNGILNVGNQNTHSNNKWLACTIDIENINPTLINWYYNNNAPFFIPGATSGSVLGNLNPNPAPNPPNCFPPARQAEEVFTENILIYPNPAKNNISIANTSASHLGIFSLMGSKILEKELSEGTNSINITHLANGIYYCKLYKKQQILTSKKLIISK